MAVVRSFTIQKYTETTGTLERPKPVDGAPADKPACIMTSMSLRMVFYFRRSSATF
jgi:hypothetical protein